MSKWWIVLWCICSNSAFCRQLPQKVACIGNSVTYGYGLPDREINCYPAQLQQLLGARYEVKNFGISGSTLLRHGHRPYEKTTAFKDMLAFVPDIAIIHLGLNDTDPRDWPDHRDEFMPDYRWLIDTIRQINPAVKIFVCRLTPIFHEHPRFKSGTRNWYAQIQACITQLAVANHTSLIDLHAALYAHPELFPDALHPDVTGAGIIAHTIYSGITSKYGGLKLAVPFSSHMVLQRQRPLKFYGTADGGEEVTVSFVKDGKEVQRKRIHAEEQGIWQVTFPAMPAGGPYQVRISTSRKTILLEDVLIGEVWICSGQSNMAFALKDALSDVQLRGDTPISTTNPQIRLLNMQPLAPTDNIAWDTTTLRKINELQYFSGSWERSDSSTAAGFSAVGWYFARKLQEKLQVPVGIIALAVGGATTESWIDRATMEQDAALTDELYRWRNSGFYQPWCRQRADTNLKNSTLPLQRHPYDPCYNYEAGVQSFTAFPIQGVIWYQGESNAHNVEQHDLLLPALVKGWRREWGYEFPFYYVQLSSLNRPSWPVFREHQLALLQTIPRAGMAVSSDVGDSTNVHPRRKREVGERLAALALHFTYLQTSVVPYGPMPLKAVREGNNIVLSFRYAGRQLKTSDGSALKGWVWEDEKGGTHPANAVIATGKVKIPVPANATVLKVRYGSEPFTRANLQNAAGLPAPNFTLKINER